MSELPFVGDAEIGRKVRRVMARDAIRSGRFPDRIVASMRNGRAEGASCTICLMPFSPSAQVYVLEFADRGEAASAHVLHIPCFEAWEAECQREHDRARAINGTQDRPVNGSCDPAREDSR